MSGTQASDKGPSDQAALEFESKFWPFRQRVQALALQLLGSPEEAEDLTQEVLLACLCRLQSQGLSFCESPERYLFQATYNRVKDRYRWKSRRPTTSLEEKRVGSQSSSSLDFEDIGMETPREAAFHEEVYNRVMDSLERLSSQERLTFLYRFLSDESYRGIAQSLGLSEDQVRIHIHRARRKISDQLKEWL